MSVNVHSKSRSTYCIDETVDIGSDFGVDCLSLGEGVVLLHFGGIVLATHLYPSQSSDVVVNTCAEQVADESRTWGNALRHGPTRRWTRRRAPAFFTA